MSKKAYYFLSIAIPLFILGLNYGISYLRDYNSPLNSSRRNAANSYNEQIEGLMPVMDSIRTTLKDKEIYVYTNDTLPLKLLLRADIDVQSTIGIDFIKADAEANAINDFLTHRNSRGFNLFLLTHNDTIQLMNLSQDALEKEQEWKIAGNYFLTNRLKEKLAVSIKKRARTNDFLGMSLEKDLAELEKQQEEIAVITETELNNRELESNIAAIAAPLVDTTNTTYLSYISAYNKNVTKEQLQENLQAMRETFFITPEAPSNYKIRSVVLSDD